MFSRKKPIFADFQSQWQKAFTPSVKKQTLRELNKIAIESTKEDGAERLRRSEEVAHRFLENYRQDDQRNAKLGRLLDAAHRQHRHTLHLTLHAFAPYMSEEQWDQSVAAVKKHVRENFQSCAPPMPAEIACLADILHIFHGQQARRLEVFGEALASRALWTNRIHTDELRNFYAKLFATVSVTALDNFETALLHKTLGTDQSLDDPVAQAVVRTIAADHSILTRRMIALTCLYDNPGRMRRVLLTLCPDAMPIQELCKKLAKRKTAEALRDLLLMAVQPDATSDQRAICDILGKTLLKAYFDSKILLGHDSLSKLLSLGVGRDLFSDWLVSEGGACAFVQRHFYDPRRRTYIYPMSCAPHLTNIFKGLPTHQRKVRVIYDLDSGSVVLSPIAQLPLGNMELLQASEHATVARLRQLSVVRNGRHQRVVAMIVRGTDFDILSELVSDPCPSAGYTLWQTDDFDDLQRLEKIGWRVRAWAPCHIGVNGLPTLFAFVGELVPNGSFRHELKRVPQEDFAPPLCASHEMVTNFFIVGGHVLYLQSEHYEAADSATEMGHAAAGRVSINDVTFAGQVPVENIPYDRYFSGDGYGFDIVELAVSILAKAVVASAHRQAGVLVSHAFVNPFTGAPLSLFAVAKLMQQSHPATWLLGYLWDDYADIAKPTGRGRPQWLQVNSNLCNVLDGRGQQSHFWYGDDNDILVFSSGVSRLGYYQQFSIGEADIDHWLRDLEPTFYDDSGQCMRRVVVGLTVDGPATKDVCYTLIAQDQPISPGDRGKTYAFVVVKDLQADLQRYGVDGWNLAAWAPLNSASHHTASYAIVLEKVPHGAHITFSRRRVEHAQVAPEVVRHLLEEWTIAGIHTVSPTASVAMFTRVTPKSPEIALLPTPAAELLPADANLVKKQVLDSALHHTP